MNESQPIVILHLSDLHFGWDRDLKDRVNRSIALEGLLGRLERIEEGWRPSAICVTGDIGWRGHETDYGEAGGWLKELLGVTQLGPEALFMCPGNHDSDREAARRNPRPKDSSDADAQLAVPVSADLASPFESFSAWCRDFRVPPYILAGTPSYLVGERQLGRVRVIAYNSAWFSQGDDDKGNLWIGLNHIKILESAGQLCRAGDPRPNHPPITLALMHHPQEWFDYSETHLADLRPVTFDYLCERTDLLLTGHEHDGPRRANMCAETAWHFSGGASYAGAAHFNSFRLIQVDGERLVYRVFEFDPRFPGDVWQQRLGPRSLQLGSALHKGGEEVSGQVIDLGRQKTKAVADALRIVEEKSRALRGSGDLPKTLPLRVSPVVDEMKDASELQRRRATRKSTLLIALPEAAFGSNRVLLLGDMGSGKSTLASLFVVHKNEREENCLAFVAPASALRLPTQFTVKDLLGSTSRYFNEQIFPSGTPISLERMLNHGTKVGLVIDGLDEVSRGRATDLLKRLEQLADAWENVSVMATGRAAELFDVSFANWKLLTTEALTDGERLGLLRGEALADGNSEGEAGALAEDLMRKLSTLPSVHSLASTPLMVRLLYRHLLKIHGGSTLTSGDLLLELVWERLGRWSVRDNKPESLDRFEREFPSEQSRAGVFGRLLAELPSSPPVPLEALRAHLATLVSEFLSRQDARVADEALAFLMRSGLAVGDDQVSFPLQPLYQVLRGYGVAERWRLGLEIDLPRDQWRTASFAGTTARRLGLSGNLRANLVAFLDELVRERSDSVAGAYVVSEFRDPELAEQYITKLSQLGERPLILNQAERFASAEAIAVAIKLAGESGFSWMFRHYLDPRFPIISTGSAVIERVFERWVQLSLDGVSDTEQADLALLVRPHLQAGTSQLHTILPLLALVVPERFTERERCWFWGALLWKEAFFGEVRRRLRDMFESGSQTLVNELLVKHAQVGYENAPFASILWMELNETEPPTQVVRALLGAYGGLADPSSFATAIQQVIRRLGPERWRDGLHEYLNDQDERVSAGAAIWLADAGYRELSALGASLVRVLHGARFARGPEALLDELIEEAGTGGIAWLQESAKLLDPRLEFHPGWWRLFLSRLEKQADRGPNMLMGSIEALSPILLVREPFLRWRIRMLLVGPYCQEYRRVLREALSNSDARVRYRAAAVVTACVEDPEAKSLEIVITEAASTPGLSELFYPEWVSFCVGLRFGASVLLNIKSSMASYDGAAQLFARAMLNRNDLALEREEYNTLVAGLSDWRAYGLDPDNRVVASPKSLDTLVKALDSEVREVSRGAAERLLRFHKGSLSLDVLARSLCLAIQSAQLWEVSELSDATRRLLEEQSFSEAVADAAGLMVGKGLPKPLLDTVREAISHEESWRDVIWSMLCGDPTSAATEDNGQWLLDIGRSHPLLGPQIGHSARDLLRHSRFMNSRGEVLQWLAIITDEFVTLSSDELADSLRSGLVIRSSAASAVLARLGETPSWFKGQHSVGEVPPPDVEAP
jgi:hypothetical protein